MAKKAKKRSAKKPARTMTRAKARGPAKKPSAARKSRPRAKAGASAMTRRADLGASADGYFDSLPIPLAAIAARLRQIVRAAAPGASEAIKWGMPVYEQDGMLCYIVARPSSGYVTLGFYESGLSLPDPDARLEGTGRNMRHCKIRSADQINPGLFTDWVRQAAAFNAAP